jgi:hypothetical protein
VLALILIRQVPLTASYISKSFVGVNSSVYLRIPDILVPENKDKSPMVSISPEELIEVTVKSFELM